MNRAFFIPIVLVAAVGSQSQTRPNGVPADFKVNARPFVKGPVRLSSSQRLSWQRMVDLTKPKPSGTLIYALGSQLTHSFPDGYFSKTIFCAPVKNINFYVRADGYPSSVTTFEVQLSKDPSSLSLVPPYAGWNKPKGLINAYRIKVPMSSKQGGLAEGPLCPIADFGSVKLSPNALTGEFSLPLPSALANTTGTNFFVRLVPIQLNGIIAEPIGPASNWERFVVSIRQDDYEKNIADKEAAAAAASAKEAALKKAKELQAQIESTRSVIGKAYEIRVLSYVPPKFSDDSVASDYFIANRKVNLSYGSKATQLLVGETYSLSALRNALNSNKTWTQELWDLASAELNLLSSGYKAAKKFAVDSIADGIELIPGVDVNPAARAAMMVALNIALAYCGIPPEIPNIDQLYNRGLDYMAATVADMALEQATGVAIEDLGANASVVDAMQGKAREAATKSLKEMFATFTKPAPFVPDCPENWGYPAPFFRRHPAMLYIEIRKKAGAVGVGGQSWQSMQVAFNSEFYTIPNVLLPRTVNERVRIPIALSTIHGPEAWNIVGMMPEKHVDPNSEVGQPYYGNRAECSVFFTTYHRLPGSGAVFSVYWPGEKLSTGYVNARSVPYAAFPSQVDAALEGPIVLGPSHYFGHSKVSFFEP